MVNDVKTPLREVRLRVAVIFTLVMLSFDSLNPVKVTCSILNLSTSYVGCLSVVLFAVIVSANAKELTYFMVKTFFHSILSIFFSSIEVLGKQNIPEHGPVIFTGNHMNQFVDGAVILITTPRRVGFLVAEKSMQKPLIGDFARACGSIPVARPQDKAKVGPGRIYLDKLRMVGDGTAFTRLRHGDKIRPGRSPEMYRVREIISDTEAVLAEDQGEVSPLSETQYQGEGNWVSYDILESIDQTTMFHHVHSALASGHCLGIFPEGGSHDRTDLLPLKAGVAAIALGTQEKHDINVPIVPVGLTYFRGHRFRGRLVVEFGQPIYTSKEISVTYKSSKRQAYQSLLQQVEDGMRSVIVTAPDYSDLKMIHTIRRLFQRNPTSMSTKAKQDLARRWSAAFRLLKDRFRTTEGSFDYPEDIRDMLYRIQSYQDALDRWGLKDHQLQHANLRLSFSKLLYIFLHGAFIITLASIPSLILNAPVGAAANYWAYTEAQKDLKASRVKLAARDVLMSKKIIFSIVAVPLLWIFYALLLFLFTSLEPRTILVLFLCCPLFSYMGIMAVEASIVDMKDLRPAFLRLLPSFQQHADSLPLQRSALQKELRALVRKYGPSLGPVYLDKTDSWDNDLCKLFDSDKYNVMPTTHDQIASSIATTFSDHDEAQYSSCQGDSVSRGEEKDDLSKKLD